MMNRIGWLVLAAALAAYGCSDEKESGGTAGNSGGEGGSAGEGGEGGGGTGGEEEKPRELKPFPHEMCDWEGDGSHYTVDWNAVPLPDARVEVKTAVVDSKGNSYWIGPLGDVFWRKPDSACEGVEDCKQWKFLGKFGDGNTNFMSAFAIDDVAYVLSMKGITPNDSEGEILRIEDGEVEPWSAGKSMVGAFRNPDGSIIIQHCGQGSCGFSRFIDESTFEIVIDDEEETKHKVWTLKYIFEPVQGPVAGGTIDECEVKVPLRDYGFVAQCGEEVGLAGEAKDLHIIAGYNVMNAPASHGMNPEDFWAFRAQNEEGGPQTLAYFDGTKWIWERTRPITSGTPYVVDNTRVLIATKEDRKSVV